MRKFPVFIVCLIFLIVASCAINPVTGKRELSLISEQEEIALGRNTDTEIQSQYGVYDDPSMSEYVRKVGMLLAPHTHRPKLEYYFAVLDAPVVNAFAVPGGYIYVTRGILAMMNSEAELAIILGHELGHVNARHSVNMMSKLVLVQLGLVVGSALNETFAKYAGYASIGIQLLFLKYSRDDERQADALGIEYARKGSYNPGEMIRFFTSLQKLGDLSGGQSLPGFLSTHPLTSERIKNVQAMLTETDKQLSIKDEYYLQKLENVVFGEDPRQGYVEGSRFYHPLLLFSFSIPQGWELQNTPSQVMMAPQGGNAALILQVEKSSESLESYAQKRMSSIEGRQLLDEQRAAINGMQSLHHLYDISQQNNESLRMRLSMIRKGPSVFSFMALSTAQNFNQYDPNFSSTVASFSELKDKKYIDRKPKRLKLVKANGVQSLEEVFKRTGMEKDLWPQLALLNGMELNSVPPLNKLIKIIQ